MFFLKELVAGFFKKNKESEENEKDEEKRKQIILEEILLKLLKENRILCLRCKDVFLWVRFITKNVYTRKDLGFKEVRFSYDVKFVDRHELWLEGYDDVVLVTFNKAREVDFGKQIWFWSGRKKLNYYWVDLNVEEDGVVLPMIDVRYLEASLMQDAKSLLKIDDENCLSYLKGFSLIEVDMLQNLAREEIWEYRKRMFYDPALELIENKVNLEEDVGGCFRYKEWLKKVKRVYERGYNYFEGVLFLGLSGVGKSYLVKASASYLGLPLYRFNLNNVLNMYVGQSEANFGRALDFLKRSCPCVVWIDEIEKFFAGWSGDNTGVIPRLLFQFLYFLQECRDLGILFMATSNNVKWLPQELIRKERFSEFWYVKVPEHIERETIFKLYAKKYGEYLDDEVSEEVLGEVVKESEGIVPAEISYFFKKLAFESIAEQNKVDVWKFRELFRTICNKEMFQKRLEKDKKLLKEVKEHFIVMEA